MWTGAEQMNKEKIIPLDEKEQVLGTLMGATCGTKIYYPEHVKKAVQGLIADLHSDKMLEFEIIRRLIKKHFGRGLINLHAGEELSK